MKVEWFSKALANIQKNMPKLELTLQDKAGHQIDFFALGTAPTNSFRNFEYDAIVRVSGARIEQKEQKFRLMAYEGNQIELTKIDRKDEVEKFPQYSFDAISLEEATEKPKGESFNLVVYVLRAYQIFKKPLGDHEISCQELLVRDNNDKQTLVELCDMATGKAHENDFILIKNATTYIHTVQVWGKSMLIRAPQDMHFNIENEAEDI